MNQEITCATVEQIDNGPEFVLKWTDCGLKVLEIGKDNLRFPIKYDDGVESIDKIIEGIDTDKSVISALQERMRKQTGILFDYDDLFSALLHMDYAFEKKIVFEDFPDVAKGMIQDVILKASESWQCRPNVEQSEQFDKFISYVISLRRFFSFAKTDGAVNVGLLYVNVVTLEFEWLAFNKDADALSKKYNLRSCNCGIIDYIERVERYVQISGQICHKSPTQF